MDADIDELFKTTTASDPKKFGQRLKFRLNQLGLNGVDLASGIGVGNTTVSQWVHGQNMPTREKIIKIIDFLECDGFWLLHGTGPAPIPTKNVQSVEFDVLDTSGRIKHLLAVNGLKPSDLAKRLEVSRATVSQWVNGIARPRGMNLVHTCELFNCTPEWLLSGRFWPDISQENDDPTSKNAIKLGDYSDCIALPLFELPQLEECIAADKLDVDSFLSNVQNFSTGRRLFFNRGTLDRYSTEYDNLLCFKIDLLSMRPLFPPNTTVGVNTLDRSIQDHELYAFLHYETIRVARLYKLPNGVVRIRHENTVDYADELISKDEMKNLVIIGRIFWCSFLF